MSTDKQPAFGIKLLRDRCQAVESSMKEFLRLSPAIEQVHKYIDERDRVHSELKRKDQRLKEIKDKEKGLVETLEDRHVEHNIKFNRMKTDLENEMTRRSNESNVTIDNLKGQLAASLDKCQDIENKYKDVETRATGLEEMLDREKQKLRLVMDNIGWEPLGNQFLESSLGTFLQSLWYTLDDHSQRVLMGGLRRSGFFEVSAEEIPISNSEPSRLLRAALVEAIISRHLSNEIFRDPIVFSPYGDVDFTEILRELNETNPYQEAMLRTLLTKTGPLIRHEGRELRRDTITAKVLNIVQPLLHSEYEREKVAEDLRRVFDNGFKVWDRAHRTSGRISVIKSFDDLGQYDDTEEPWDFPQEYEADRSDISESAMPDPGGVLTTLFPRIWNERSNQVLHSGKVLWSDLHVVVAGRQEQRHMLARMKPNEVRKTQGRRLTATASSTKD
ncbi:putative mei5 protein [Phaeomoniella chlamydospora]|uniref:Putative mei5 protein n=1 Tax=Phaeomoniella chlamydospora TaxID=158046 RepID=A0A0G2GQ52_PHACM|nr:putative mei5 protein [Phaeomoniella chlamydospora]